MFFAPYIVRCSDSSSVQVKIDTALPADISATHNAPLWQTNWDSPLLSDPSVQKFAMKTEDGELVALAAYQISGRKAYVYILYAESAPASNPVLTKKAERKYCGIGAALIAFGIKFSIDNGCRGDVVFDAKQMSWPSTMRKISVPNGSPAQRAEDRNVLCLQTRMLGCCSQST